MKLDAKEQLSLFFVFILPLAVLAQPGSPTFGPQTVIDVADNPKSVVAGDIDGDGLNDVIAALAGDNQIVWYKNLGNLQFSPRIIISSEDDWPVEVLCEDVDSDGDNDVISASSYPMTIRIHVNNGLGQFDTSIVAYSENACEVHDLAYGDMDGDQIGDIIVIERVDFNFWLKNDGSMGFELGNYIAPQSLYAALNADIADLDGDSLNDVLVVKYFPVFAETMKEDRWPDVVYYANLGDGVFENPVMINPDLDQPKDATLADFNGDGDIDVMMGDYGGTIGWQENDGSGNFGELKIIDDHYTFIYRLFAADAENDGDMDFILTTLWDGEIAYYENEGFGVFSEAEIVTNNAIRSRGLFMADLDNDGDKEILSASWEDGKIAYYENHAFTVGSEEVFVEKEKIQVHPNPFFSSTNLRFHLYETSHVTIKIFNINGKLTSTLLDKKMSQGKHELAFDAEGLKQGIYFYSFTSDNINKSGKLILTH